MTQRGAPAILLTGSGGQVGWELRRALAPLGRVHAPSRQELDLSDAAAVRAVVRAHRPALIVNAGAYTAVDRAEEERAVAFAVNAVAPQALAEEAARRGTPVVHYSTDYVYDGTKGSPYTEADATAPLGAYGETKLAGDEAIAVSGAPHLIFRTSWVYAARRHNFLLTMLRLAHEREELRVVADQFGAPTPARLIADVTAQVLARHATGAGFELPASAWGIYHVATCGVASWHEFAAAIVARDPRRAEQRCRVVTAITTSEYPTPARRPAFSVLDTRKLETAFGLRMPDWHEGLALVLASLA